MRKTYSKIACMLLAVFFSIAAFAQTTTITGNVKNSTNKEVVPAVSVTIKGTNIGTFTDDKGNFTLSTTQKPPFTLLISSIGFENQEVKVSDATSGIMINVVPGSTMGTEIVVSASRVPERILESPVSVERVNASAIRIAPAASYYDIVSNLKGVDVVTSSLNFKTPTTRGFGGSGNTRFNQVVDGMDNQAPGLNFSVGAIIGLSELDVDNMELLPGASSALYGPGGMNGTLLVSSKNPFKYTGLSFQVKEGIMNTDGRYREASAYHNWAVRWAQNVNDRFAYKINAEFIKAQDWLASDQRNYDRLSTKQGVKPGSRATDPNYDGINVYGDETTADIRAVLQGIGQQAYFLQPYINTLMGSPINVSRTGYNESDIIDPTTLNFKLGGAIHYKITDKLEAVLAGNWGTGNTVYTGSDRYSFKDFKMGQYKFELNGKHWFFRTYTTREDAGQSFNATVTTRLTNEAWKPTITFTNGQPNPQSTDWLVQYSQAYLAGKLGGMGDLDAHTQARQVADVGRPAAGSAEFKKIFDQVRGVSIADGGGLFIEKSNMYQNEAQYNFSHITGKVADILVGANYKVYNLNSEGTLFTDSSGPIRIWEIGAYLQATRRLFDDKLKLTVSGRYDKNQNFNGRFTPRATAVVTVAKNSNIRLSYQTAYRFPSTQQQWIDLTIGGGVQLIGGDKSFQSYYNFDKNAPYSLNPDGSAGSTYNFKTFKPESVSSFELGYKGLHLNSRLMFDIYGYYGQYNDFLARTTVFQKPSSSATADPANDQPFSVPLNIEEKVKTYGFGIGLEYRVYRTFMINTNFSSDVLKDVPANFIAFFNAPKYRFNIGLSNGAIGEKKRAGFSINYRWQDAFFYEGDFANGNVNAIHTLDAQVSYKIPQIKSIIKIGGNNILNEYYFNAVGNSFVGGLYYVSFGFNIY